MRQLINNIPRLLRALVLICLVNVVIFFVLRLAFWIVFHQVDDPASGADLLHAFYLGTKFDIQLATLFILPLALLGGFGFMSPFRCRPLHWFWIGYISLCMTVVLLIYAIDFGHYAYLNTRVNAMLFSLLKNFNESMRMVWQTYAVVPWSLVLVAVIGFYTWWLHRVLNYLQRQPAPALRWRGKTLSIALSTLLILAALYGNYTNPWSLLPTLLLFFVLLHRPIVNRIYAGLARGSRLVSIIIAPGIIVLATALTSLLINVAVGFSYYPLRWSHAFFTPHAFSTAVASNPVLYFANTLKNRKLMYDLATTRKYYPVMRDFLKPDTPDETTLNYTRHVRQTPPLTTQPNIVMVFLESFASYKTSTYGNPLNPTPHFDRIAKSGLLFTDYYTPLTGTARSVFAAVTGLPDIELHETSTRNPLVVNQRTLINAYKNYEKFYFIGGSASWGNIRGLLAYNIPKLHLYEEADYSSPRMDVWGVDDLHLFDEVNKVLRQQTKPFFAIIQTAGNHRPYNIPQDNDGFQRDTQPQSVLEQNGFISNEEYNSFRFMDHSIGHFIKVAQRENYFANTVFVFYGDHGIAGYGGAHTPEYMSRLKLNNLNVPLLFYAPKLIKPRRSDMLASEVDLLPTIAGLTLKEFTNTTLGRDLLDSRYDDQRYAFTMLDNTIGLLSKDYYYTYNLANQQKSLFALHQADPLQNIAPQNPATRQALETLCNAIYETTKYMLYHNQNPAVDTAVKSP
ncbi:MAG: sulfatase-like hydrolase/transferase [Gammaproteobacteria bacterium]|nr:sulfatase-like hydrolase/transferase [Gammaproteobacteria bacterium]